MFKYHFVRLMFGLILITQIGCQKNADFPHFNERKSDFWQATFSDHTYGIGPEYYLFTKHYRPGTILLDKMTVSFLNIATTFSDKHTDLKITYAPQEMIITDESADTIAIFEFKPNGQLLRAWCDVYVLPHSIVKGRSSLIFQFIYSGNRLDEVKLLDEPYVKIKYDQTNKNVASIEFGQNFGTIFYQYDYNRTANGQYYPDEKRGDYFRFWYFLKYLNLLPELQPKNLLTGSYDDTQEYPGPTSNVYSNQSFDAANRVISYEVNSTFVNTSAFSVESWNVYWSNLK